MRIGISRISIGAIVVSGLLIFSFYHPKSADSKSGTRYYVELGVPSTGLNRALSAPIWRYPQFEAFIPVLGPFVPFAGFNTSGAFDPALGAGNGNSLELTPATPVDALIASHLDALGLGFIGVNAANVPDRVLNVPIDETEVLVDDFGVVRAPVPCATGSSDPRAITRAGPCEDPVALDQWLSAGGISVTTCRPDGSARVNSVVYSLRPNRMYTVWLVTENFDGVDPGTLFKAVPFGGVPNLVVSNKNGWAKFTRELGFCPQDESAALGYVLAYRGNGQNYGGVPIPFLNQEDPDTAFAGFDGLIPGTVAQVQLSFNISGESFDPSDLPSASGE
ncbi:MAG: hypothetical protein AAGC55_02305 [Myxococcota bacterium]